MAGNERPLKVFLCYAHADFATVRRLYSRLKRDGVDVWLDKETLLPGSEWEYEIRNAVRNVDVVVVCLSKQFSRAGFRQKEVRLALDTAKEMPYGEIFIIPARLEECENLESLKSLQWVDLFEVGGYQKLVGALRERAERIGATLLSGESGRSIVSRSESEELNNAIEPATQMNGNDQVFSGHTPVTALHQAQEPDKGYDKRIARNALVSAKLIKPRSTILNALRLAIPKILPLWIIGTILILVWFNSFTIPREKANIQSGPIITTELTGTSRDEVTQNRFVATTESTVSEPAISTQTNSVITKDAILSSYGTIFDNTIWWIQMDSGPAVQSPMSIFLNGEPQASTFLLSIGHKERSGEAWPQFVAIYNTGYIRITMPSKAFGTSFVLGPSYWKDNNIYIDTVQISQIDIKTDLETVNGPIKLTIHARDYNVLAWPNYHLDITYDITLPEPGTTAVEMYVKEEYVVSKDFSLARSKQSTHEAFKLVNISTMYIDDYNHDSDGIAYLNQDGTVLKTNFSDVECNTLIFDNPDTLFPSKPWVEVRHSDDLGWQGNTPNTLVSLDSIGKADRIVPQGFISCSNDPNDDNVGVWLNLESDSLHFTEGDSNTIEYTLAVQDDPVLP